MFQKDRKKKVGTVQACLRTSEKPQETAFKTEDKHADEPARRKRIFVEENLFGREASRTKPEKKQQQQEKKLKIADWQLKGKVSNLLKDSLAASE